MPEAATQPKPDAPAANNMGIIPAQGPKGPVTHDPSRHYGEYKAPPPPPSATVTDPLRSFERDGAQHKTDLYQWQTFTEADRALRLKGMVDGWNTKLSAAKAITEEARRITELKAVIEERWRALSFIVWIEARPSRQGSVPILKKAAELLVAGLEGA